MQEFVCPECYLRTRPHALFVSRETTWWSVSPAEASLYRQICSHREALSGEAVLGCSSMRFAIDPWLRSENRPRAVFGGGEVAIAGIATASHLIEPRAECPREFSPSAGGSFPDPGTRDAFQCNPGSTEVRSFDLRDVVLVAARLILFHGGQRITETRYLVDDRGYWMQPPQPRESHDFGGDKTVVIGANLAFRNYYHWLMQCLPAIDCSVRTIGAANCVLALPPLAPWQEQTLAMLGHAEIPRIEIDFTCHYHFEHAHWCEYLNGRAEDFLSPRCLEMLDRLAATVPPIDDAPERLYVARLDSKNRVIRNEAEVRQLLEHHGFVTLVPGFIPLETQIGLFKSARVVVGAHGAGLTNLAFCQAGTTVLELLQSTLPELYMNRIALGRGLRYHAECFECESGGDVNLRDWLVDMKQLEASLISIL